MGTRSNLDRGRWIGWLESTWRAGQRRGSPATLLRGGARPEFFELGVPGVNRAGVWSGSMPVACVIHWSGLHGAAVVEAARRSRARRRACWRAVLGTGTGAQGLVCVRVQEKGEPRRGAGLCRRGIAAAEQRRRNAGDGVLATRVAYTPLQRAQKKEGCREMLTEARNRAGWWCREFGGEDQW